MKIAQYLSPANTRWLVIGAVLWFCGVVGWASLKTPAYSSVTQAISELAAPGAPYKLFVQWAGFFPLGLALGLNALAIQHAPHYPMRRNWLVPGLAIQSLAVLIAGIFPTDIGGKRESFSGLVHALAGLTLLTSVSITPLLAAIATKSGKLCWDCLLTSLLLIGLFALLPNAILPGLVAFHRYVLGDFFNAWYAGHGLVQRLILGLYFLWLAIFLQRTARRKVEC